MAENKALACSVCGSYMIERKDARTSVCKACGNTIVINDNVSTELISLLSAGNVELKACDFDKAKQYFSAAAECDDTAAEAFWGCFLAKYGIEYVYDIKSGKNLPTCHRACAVSVYDDSDFKKTLALSEGTQNRYAEKGDEIERIRKEIIEIASKKDPYDIFICYKATYEENGKQYFTKDRELAKDIYHELDKQNYKVFFAEETLRGFAGEDYEPIIYSALSTAAVMLVVTTSVQHLESVWVKNEWSRFLEICEYDRNRKLIMILKDATVSELPVRLKSLQALDANRYAFADDLRTAIEKTMSAKSKSILERKQITEKNYVKNLVYHTEKIIKRSFERREQGSVTPTEEGLLRNAEKFLSIGNFKKALKLYQSAIEENPNASRAHWGKILAECEAKRTSEFIANGHKFSDFDTIRNVFNCAPSETAAKEYLSNFQKATMSAAAKSGSKACEMFRECIEWTEENDAFLFSEKFAEEATRFIPIDTKWAKRLFDVSLAAIPQEKADEFVKRNLMFADELRKREMFADAQIYFAKALDVDRGSQDAMWGIYLCEQKIANMKQAYCKIKHADQVTETEKILAYDTKNTKIYEFFIAIAKEYARHERIQKAVNIFDAITSLIPTEMNGFYRIQLLQFADLLLVIKAFKHAKKYYEQLIGYNVKDAEAHWGILKVKLRATSDYDLVLRKRELSDYSEFMDTVNCDSQASDHYMRFLDEQLTVKSNPDKKIRYIGYKRRAEKTKCVPIFGQGDKLWTYDQFNTADNNGNRSIEKKLAGQPFSGSDKKHIAITLIAFALALAIQIGLSVVGYISYGGDAESIQIVVTIIFVIVTFIGAIYVSRSFWAAFGCALFSALIGSGIGLGLGMLFTEVSAAGGIFLGTALAIIFFLVAKFVSAKVGAHSWRLSEKVLTGVCVIVLGVLAIIGSFAVIPALEKKAQTIIEMQYWEDGLQYDMYARHAVLSGGTDNLRNVEIPDTVNNKPITKIKSEAFAYNNTIETLTIGSMVKEIEENAFLNCQRLKTLKSESNDALKKIGEKAFFGCLALSEVKLPQQFEEVEESAFENSGLKNFSFPTVNFNKIGEKAFYNCPLNEITIPSCVETIGESAFGGNGVYIVHFKTPKTTLSIGNYAFNVSHYLLCDFTQCATPPQLDDRVFDNDCEIYISRQNFSQYYSSQYFLNYRNNFIRT